MLLGHKLFKWFHIASAFLKHLSLKRGNSAQRLFPFSCPSLCFPLLIIVTGTCSLPSAWGLMAELLGFASYGSGLQLGAHLAADSGSSWMPAVPKLHFAMQLLKGVKMSDAQKS